MATSNLSPTVTVAIPTIGRFEEVRDTVETILGGSRIPDEILVSDQNHPPIPKLDSYLATRAPLVRHFRTEPKGVVFNMNALLRAAKGDIILYLDDDIVPSPRLVEAHLANYADSAIHGVAGRVEQPAGDLPSEKVGRVGAFEPWTGRTTFRFNGLVRQKCVFAPGGNMSFRRTDLLEIAGFDEEFVGNGYFFESDASLRFAKRFPGGLVFDPAAELKHLASPRGGARILDRSIHHAFFVRNGIRLYRRHSPALAIPFLALKLAALTIAKAVYRGSPEIATRGLAALGAGFASRLELKDTTPSTR